MRILLFLLALMATQGQAAAFAATSTAGSCGGEVVVQTPGARSLDTHYAGDSRNLPASARINANALPDADVANGFEGEE